MSEIIQAQGDALPFKYRKPPLSKPFSKAKKKKATSPAEAKKSIESRPEPSNLYKPVPKKGITSGILTNAPPSVAELARSLKNNVDLIYEWVYNNIEFHPSYGLQKGAFATILDGYGNSFDQACLMVELLRASGYTASYMMGNVQLSSAQMTALFDTENTNWTVPASVFTEGGMPFTATANGDGSLNNVVFSHCWVRVNIGGTNYVFDPSYKSYTYTTGINLATAMGYSKTSFLSSCMSGTTLTSDYVKNVNRTSLRSQMQTYATNLASYINTNLPSGDLKSVISGRVINPVSGTLRQSSLSYQKAGDTPTVWTTDIPTQYRATMQIQISGIDVTLTSDQMAGRRTTIWWDELSRPVLAIDGTTVATGTAGIPDSWNEIDFTITHPYADTGDDQIASSWVFTGQNVAIVCGWGPTGRGPNEYHRKQLNQNKFNDSNSLAEAVLGEAECCVGYAMLSHHTIMRQLLDSMYKSITIFHHDVYIINGDTTVSVNGVTGTRMDFAVKVDADPNIIKQLLAGSLMGGVSEALACQSMTGNNSLCTTTVLDAANTGSQKIFDATSANWSANVRPNLTGYDTSTLDWLENNWIAPGWRLILPENGTITVASWTGDGFYGASPGFGIASWFDTAMKGGIDPNNVPPSDFKDSAGKNMPNPNTAPHPTSQEPIDLYTGAYLCENTDISIGSGDYPYRLSLVRSYNSDRRLENDDGFGLGWTHNFAISAKPNVDPSLSMGRDSAVQAVAALATAYVITDLFVEEDTTPIQNFVINGLIGQWWLEQMQQNTLIIKTPVHHKFFVKQPDGSFEPRPGIRVKAQKNMDGTFKQTDADGSVSQFNASGKIVSWTHPNGSGLTFTYNGSGQLATVTNGLGRTLTFTYTSGLISSVSDGTGRSVSYGYDANKNLTSFTDTLSHQTTYQYDQPGRMTKVFLPANPTTAVVTNTYDSLHRVQTQKDYANNTWTYYFATSRSEEVNPNSNSRILYYNWLGLQTKDVNQLGFATTFTYDGRGRMTKITLPEGNSENYAYNSNDMVTSITSIPKSGSGLSNIVNSFTYDTTWTKKIKTKVDGRGNTTTFNYDASTGNLLSVVKPTVGGLTPQVTYTYNARGQMLTMTDETGIVTKFTYDTTYEKMLTSVVDFGTTPHLNLTTSYGYDSVGNVTSVTDPNGAVWSTTWNSERLRTQTTSPSPFSYITNYTYDANNNWLTTSKQTGGSPAWQTVTNTWTANNKVKTVTDPLGYVTTNTYDNMNRLWKVLDAAGKLTTVTYNAAGKVANKTDNAGTVFDARTYTNNGFIATQTDARSKVTTYTYDGFDRSSKTTYADASWEGNSSYDGNNNVLTYRMRSGNTVTFTYDALNRISTKTPTGQPTVTFTYDLAGRMKTHSTSVVAGNPASGSFQINYDTAGRKSNEVAPDGKTTGYQLDSNGNVTRVTWPDSYYVTRVYDAMNRLTNVKLNGSATSAATIAYDQLSRRQTLTYANGAVTNYGYQLNDDMTSLQHVYNGTTSVTFTHGYNQVHQETSMGVNDNTYMWHPSAAGTVTYGTADNVNKYPTVGGTAQTYNTNGALTGDGTWTFGYDVENRLTSASKTGVSMSFVYDPLGRQIQKTVGAVKTRYVYSDVQRIADYDGVTNTLQNRHVHGVFADEVLLSVSSAGVVTYRHTDRRRSQIATTSAAGVVSSVTKYSPTGISASVPAGNFGYTGQLLDTESGFYNYKNRYMSPVQGRFLQPDPAGYDVRLNLFTYVANDPLNLVDPLGLAPWGDGPTWGNGDGWGTAQGWGNGEGWGNGPKIYGMGGDTSNFLGLYRILPNGVYIKISPTSVPLAEHTSVAVVIDGKVYEYGAENAQGDYPFGTIKPYNTVLSKQASMNNALDFVALPGATAAMVANAYANLAAQSQGQNYSAVQPNNWGSNSNNFTTSLVNSMGLTVPKINGYAPGYGASMH